MYEQVNDKNDNISEINIVNNKKKFDFYDVDYDYISPYNYDDYFKKIYHLIHIHKILHI